MQNLDNMMNDFNALFKKIEEEGGLTRIGWTFFWNEYIIMAEAIIKIFISNLRK
jgi:hypothetical protein